jgi:hypothetical protein
MNFTESLDPSNRKAFLSLGSPVKIQEFLDTIPYVGEDLNRTPLRVLQDRQCHCLDGGFLGALALSYLGHPPLLVDLVPVPGIDDDHVLAVFRINNLWGCVAKSNFTGLRYRDPVFRTLRELVMSFFEVFYNIDGIKTLRGYTRPFNLHRFDRFNWQTEQAGTDYVVNRFYALTPIPTVPEGSIPLIAKLDKRSYEVGFIGVNMDGLFKQH